MVTYLQHNTEQNVGVILIYLEWESRFTSGLNAAKNTDHIKNASNKNCSELNFLQGTQ